MYMSYGISKISLWQFQRELICDVWILKPYFQSVIAITMSI